MTKEQVQELINKINQKSGNNLQCNICHGKSWSVTENIFQMLEYKDGKIVLGGSVSILPLIPITCNDCGNTIFINAIKVGLVSPPNETKINERTDKE